MLALLVAGCNDDKTSDADTSPAASALKDARGKARKGARAANLASPTAKKIAQLTPSTIYSKLLGQYRHRHFKELSKKTTSAGHKLTFSYGRRSEGYKPYAVVTVVLADAKTVTAAKKLASALYKKNKGRAITVRTGGSKVVMVKCQQEMKLSGKKRGKVGSCAKHGSTARDIMTAITRR